MESSTVTIEEAAQIIGTNPQHVRTLIRQGILNAFANRLGEPCVVGILSIDKYLLSQTKTRSARTAKPKQDAGQLWKARIAPDKVDEAKRRLEEIGIALEPARKPKQAAS